MEVCNLLWVKDSHNYVYLTFSEVEIIPVFLMSVGITEFLYGITMRVSKKSIYLWENRIFGQRYE